MKNNKQIIEEVLKKYPTKMFQENEAEFIFMLLEEALTLKDKQQAQAVDDLKKIISETNIIEEQLEEIDKIFGSFDNHSLVKVGNHLNEDKEPDVNDSNRFVSSGSLNSTCECGLDKDRHKPCDDCGKMIHSCGMANNPCHYCHEKDCKKFKPKKEVVILDNNELSISKYAEEYPENWEAMTEPKKEATLEEIRNRMKRIADMPKPKKEGCGETFNLYENKGERCIIFCGDKYGKKRVIKLCPKCQGKEEKE